MTILNKAFIGLLLTLTLVFSSTAYAQSVEQNYRKGSDAFGVGDYATALKYWEPLAEAGNAKAQNNLGYMYEYGYGVMRNYSMSVYWYHKASKQDNHRAQYNLGWMYYDGKGVLKHNLKALYWFSKAAKQGNNGAQNKIASMYANGEGVERNRILAYVWASIASFNGSSSFLRDEQVIYLSTQKLNEAQRLAQTCLDSNYQVCP